MTPPPERDDEQLHRLVAEALEETYLGKEVDLTDLCREYPHLESAVRASVAAANSVRLENAGSGLDRWLGSLMEGRYLIESRLGAGAMGVVYRARDQELDRGVAIKILRPGLMQTKEAETRFEREARAIASISHPAVVQIFDRGQTESGDHYLVLELLEGQPLLEYLPDRADPESSTDPEPTAEEAPSLRDRVEWIADLASGLRAVHEREIVHRDVKPSNIFVRDDGNAVLLDFGIAAQKLQAALTRTGAPVGTPAYMPPEVLRTGTKPGPAADIYGLTATLYHLVTDAAPYTGTPSQVLAQVARVDPRAAVQLVPGLSRDLQAILDKGMARRPEDRYASVAELESDLRAFLAFQPVSARYRSPLVRAVKRGISTPAFRVAAILILLLGGVLLGRAWRESWLESRREQFVEVWRRLPPNLSINGAKYRRTLDPEHRAALYEQLDQCVELAEGPLPVRLVRGGYRLDQGDSAGAAEDFAVVAASVSGDFGEALTASYEEWFALAEPFGQLDLGNLPEPATADQRLILGYHLYRAGNYPLGLEVLGHESLAENRYAAELCALYELAKLNGVPKLEQESATTEFLEEIVRLEASTGYVSAMSGHLRGSALLLLQRYEKAYGLYVELLKLTRLGEPLLTNGGFAAYQIGMHGAAEPLLLESMRLQPQLVKSFNSLFFSRLESLDFDGASEVLRSMPLSESPSGAAKRLRLQGALECDRAYSLLDIGDVSGARTAAQYSLDLYSRAAELHDVGAGLEEVMAQGLISMENGPVFRALLRQLEESPLNVSRLKSAVNFQPPQLSVEDAEALASFLRSLSLALSE